MTFVLSFMSSLWRVGFPLSAILLELLSHVTVAQSPAGPGPPKEPVAISHFTDVAAPAGLTMRNVFGGVDTKKYILETTGTAVAVFDYYTDRWPDIFIVNGTTLEPPPRAEAPTNQR